MYQHFHIFSKQFWDILKDCNSSTHKNNIILFISKQGILIVPVIKEIENFINISSCILNFCSKDLLLVHSHSLSVPNWLKDKKTTAKSKNDFVPANKSFLSQQCLYNIPFNFINFDKFQEVKSWKLPILKLCQAAKRPLPVFRLDQTLLSRPSMWQFCNFYIHLQLP